MRLVAAFAGCAGGTLGTILLAAAFAGCVDPKKDYDDWVARSADARAAGPLIDAGQQVDGALPDGGFTETYAMACVSQLSSQDITKATFFKANVTFTPSDSGGTLQFQDQPLVVGATSFSQTAGDPGEVGTCKVAADGTCAMSFGATTIPGAANAVTGQDVVFTDSTLHFVVGPGDHLCAGLAADVTQPFATTFDPTQNTCLFFPSTGQIPVLTADMQNLVHCP